MFRWEKNNWIKSDKKTPENLDIIQTYYDWHKQGYRINLQKVKGHSGVLWNEVADALATGRMNPQEVMEKYGKKE
jgi:ribonuclease HI